MNVEEQPFLRAARSTKNASPALGVLDIAAAFLATEIMLGLLVMAFLSGSSIGLASITGISIVLVSQTLRSLSPYVVTKFGVGPVKQWNFRFERRDILRGVGFGLVLMVVVASSNLIGLELFDLQTDEVSNTKVLTDAKESSSVSVLLVLLVVIIGAPVSEELFYRGLVLRVFERIGSSFSVKRKKSSKRYGYILGVLVSALFFALMHAPTPSDGQTVELPDGQTVELPDGQTVELPDGQTVKLLDCKTAELPDGQTVKLPDRQTVELADGQTVKLLACQTVKSEARYVVWFSIFLVGLILGVIAMKYKRLGPSIIAHATLNSITTIAVFFQA